MGGTRGERQRDARRRSWRVLVLTCWVSELSCDVENWKIGRGDDDSYDGGDVNILIVKQEYGG